MPGNIQRKFLLVLHFFLKWISWQLSICIDIFDFFDISHIIKKYLWIRFVCPWSNLIKYMDELSYNWHTSLRITIACSVLKRACVAFVVRLQGHSKEFRYDSKDAILFKSHWNWYKSVKLTIKNLTIENCIHSHFKIVYLYDSFKFMKN